MTQGDLIVLQVNCLFGILIDRDVVVRVLAEAGYPPLGLTIPRSLLGRNG